MNVSFLRCKTSSYSEQESQAVELVQMIAMTRRESITMTMSRRDLYRAAEATLAAIDNLREEVSPMQRKLSRKVMLLAA